jgi:SAM-dependent methyltransferase
MTAGSSAERHDAAHEAADRHADPWWGVHASRYRFAQTFASDRRALDVACGSGYGLPLLAERARAVIGVDGDLPAAVKARRWSQGTSASVVVSDACRLPFADNSWDLVTSFETLEHLHDRARFIAELRRVLADGGSCLLSTPNAKYTQPVNGRPRNPFHVHEYEPAELAAELGRQFGSVTLMGQRLNPRFTISPFWDDQERMPRTLGPLARRFTWRVLNRTPSALADRASLALWGHRLIPTEFDYDFTADGLDESPVLVAVCTERRRAH